MTSETDGETEQNLIGSCHFKQQNLNPATEPRLRSNSWPRKVFERVQYHVLDLLGRCNFGSKSHRSKIADSNLLKMDQNCSLTRYQFRKEVIVRRIAVLVHFQIV